MLLGNLTVDGIVPLQPCVLGAFSESGIPVGYTAPFAVDGLRYFSLTVYGDDLSTNEIDGMSAGEAFELRLYLAATDTVLSYRVNGSRPFSKVGPTPTALL